MKKISLILSSISSMVIISSSVSCSTSWTKWNKNNQQTRPEYNFPVPKIADKKLWEVSPSIKDAWNTNTNILDLAKVRNQYELIQLIGEYILNMKSQSPIDSFWNDVNGMKNYIKNIKSNFSFKFILNDQEQSFVWDIDNIKINIIDAIEEYNKLTNPKEINEAKAFDVSEKGINLSTNTPNDLAGVAIKGSAFLKIGAVNGLLKEDPNSALKMAKLVNLPKKAFAEFTNLLIYLDKLLDTIFNSKIIKDWQIQQLVNWNIKSNGSHYEKNISDTNILRDIFKGCYVIKILQK